MSGYGPSHTRGKKAQDRRVFLDALHSIQKTVCWCIRLRLSFFFFCLRSGASRALHRSVSVVSVWESCAWCREDWGDSCPPHISTEHRDSGRRNAAWGGAAHLLLGAGLEVTMLKLVSHADVRHSDVVFVLKTLEICSSK